MESYKKYQRAKHDTKVVLEWIANKDKVDSQSRTKYELVKISFAAEYCGQAYAGATNYHKSPEAFNTAMEAVIRREFPRLFEMALELLQDAERAALVACESDIVALSSEIEAAKPAKTFPNSAW